jgi:arsenite-transporting ATPase
VELDADRALKRWIAARRQRLRTILARGTYLDDDDIDRFLSLSLPGVNELIGLVELTRLARARRPDDVVVDTAPTGHTLRLLAMPETLGRIAAVLDDMQAKHRFLAESLGGRWRPDDTDALIHEIAEDSRDLGALLRDRARSTLAWVLLPEWLALEETNDALRTLDAAGMTVSDVIVNRVLERPPSGCPLCTPRAEAERRTIAAARRVFGNRTLRIVGELDDEPRGPQALRRVARALERPAPTTAASSVRRAWEPANIGRV